MRKCLRQKVFSYLLEMLLCCCSHSYEDILLNIQSSWYCCNCNSKTSCLPLKLTLMLVHISCFILCPILFLDGLQEAALLIKKINFSSYIRKFRRDRLQSHIWRTASSYIVKYLRISSYIRKPFLIYDFATASIWISLYMRKILFSFLSVWYR
jgi:hypothetical protein